MGLQGVAGSYCDPQPKQKAQWANTLMKCKRCWCQNLRPITIPMSTLLNFNQRLVWGHGLHRVRTRTLCPGYTVHTFQSAHILHLPPLPLPTCRCSRWEAGSPKNVIWHFWRIQVFLGFLSLPLSPRVGCSCGGWLVFALRGFSSLCALGLTLKFWGPLCLPLSLLRCSSLMFEWSAPHYIQVSAQVSLQETPSLNQK